MKFLLLTLALTSITPVALADYFTPPSTAATLICTNPNLNALDHAEEYATCTQSIIPEVCAYWVDHGDFIDGDFTGYMRAWNTFCATYAANETNKQQLPPNAPVSPAKQQLPPNVSNKQQLPPNAPQNP
ncbi:hypothetical protein [Anthocerotibacter panamensis]|uniref:hypothetical protein n=1 Tax=Anthocerotibacter panamensis TaxID=2857077 RepID=UPI001C4078D3|nr:hypothetical protein [Anthocerotibacter panamensis]